MYDLNQIPYDYTVEVKNRFKRLHLIDRVPEELWMEVHDIVQETGIKTIPMEKKCKKATWLSEEALQIAVKRREANRKGEKERYTHLTARRSNQSILKEISPEYSLERLMLKLKRQYFGHLMQRAGSFEKTLMLGKIEGRRRSGRQRMRWLDDITDSMDIVSGGLQEWVMDREAWSAVIHGVTKSWTRLSN